MHVLTHIVKRYTTVVVTTCEQDNDIRRVVRPELDE